MISSTAQRDWFLWAATTIAAGIIIAASALGTYHVAKSYAAGAKVFPDGEVPFLESDNYKWSNWVNGVGHEDSSEATVGDRPIYIQWSSLPRLYFGAVVGAAEAIWGTGRGVKNHALFFSMPLLALLTAAAFSWYFIFRLNDRFGGITFPLLLVSLEATRSHFLAGAPDHHGLVVFFAGFFLVSLFQQRQMARGAWGAGLAAAGALWVSPLSFIPILGMTGGAILAGKMAGWSNGEWRLNQSSFWKRWSYIVLGTGTTLWLFDYAGRGGFHMETLNPLWILSVFAGGQFVGACLPQTSGDRGRVPALAWGLITAAGPVACFFPAFFWTGSVEIESLLREIFELHPGKLDTLYLVLPFGFAALAAAWAGSNTLRIMVLIGAAASALYLWQVRWLPLALLPALLAICHAAKTMQGNKESEEWTGPIRNLIVGLVSLQTLWVAVATVRQGHDEWNYVRETPPSYRVAAFAGVASQAMSRLPKGHFVSNPNLTSAIHHFSGLKGVGSVYWESKPNMRQAARILTSTEDEDEATRQYIKKHGIRYIAVLPQLPTAPYYDIENKRERIAETLEARLITDRTPTWLQPIIKLQDPWPGLFLFGVKE